jgi:cell division protease FtsH
VGVGASRVRSLFLEARKLAPCIVFVDEIDAVGRKRGSNMGVAHEEREQTLNQILVEMDGFDPRANVIVVAATNRADVLDEALLRPGRFDRQVHLDLPDAAGRESILRVHARGKPLEPTVDLQALAKLTTGLSGADLENLVNEAAILAARRDLHRIGVEELEEALDRIVAGPRRKSRLLTGREREITAHHEIGHALVAWAHPHADRPHKVTIVSRGMTGGHTRLLPDEDRNMWSKSEFEAAIATALGGHAVEEMLYGEVTTGPSSDLQRATDIARRMVTEFGMSKELGPLVFQARSIWGEAPSYTSFGEKAAGRIEAEVRHVVSLAHQRTRHIVQSNRAVLLEAAEELKERETLSADDLDRVFAGVQRLDHFTTLPEEPVSRDSRRGLMTAWRRRPARVADGTAALLASQRYRR